jgi:hypothetical protein
LKSDFVIEEKEKNAGFCGKGNQSLAAPAENSAE